MDKEQETPLKIAFLGDVVPGGILALNPGVKALDSQIEDLLAGMDLVVANLESPFGRAEQQVSGKPIIFSRPEDAVRLKEMNIAVVSLANNHIFDLGSEGFQNTVQILDSMSIAYCGAGMNEEEARTPLIIDLNGRKIAFLAYCCDIKGISIAGCDHPGVALLDPANIKEDIAETRSLCDLLFVMLHYGAEYTWLPDSSSRNLIKDLISSGADGVIGGHSHRIQPYGKIHNKPYFFSLGNFLFPDYIIGPPQTMFYPPPEPKEINIKELPMMPVNRPADKLYHRIWRPWSRYGMIAILQSIGPKISYATLLTHSSKRDSRLKLLCASKRLAIIAWLKLLNLVIASPVYRVIYNSLISVARLLRRSIYPEIDKRDA